MYARLAAFSCAGHAARVALATEHHAFVSLTHTHIHTHACKMVPMRPHVALASMRCIALIVFAHTRAWCISRCVCMCLETRVTNDCTHRQALREHATCGRVHVVGYSLGALAALGAVASACRSADIDTAAAAAAASSGCRGEDAARAPTAEHSALEIGHAAHGTVMATDGGGMAGLGLEGEGGGGVKACQESSEADRSARVARELREGGWEGAGNEDLAAAAAASCALLSPPPAVGIHAVGAARVVEAAAGVGGSRGTIQT